MKGAIVLVMVVLLSPDLCASASDFGVAENALSQFRALRYENIYTRVPTTGKLVTIKITDNGTVYYICREQNGFAIYHLEIRPMEGYEEKLEQEIKEKSRTWNKVHPDDLLFTKERLERDLRKYPNKYSEAVWIRNEIVLPEPPKPR